MKTIQYLMYALIIYLQYKVWQKKATAAATTEIDYFPRIFILI